MRLLLLGCTGFIGNELVPALLNEGHNLCIVSRKNIKNLKINIHITKNLLMIFSKKIKNFLM